LSFHFLWDASSPLYDGGCVDKEGHNSDCWLVKNTQYDPIVKEILTTPKYLKSYFAYAAKESWRQLYSFEIEDLAPMMEGSPVIGNIWWRYKKEYNQYISAKQAFNPVTYRGLSLIQNILIGMCLFVLILFFFIKKIRQNISLNLYLFLGIILTAVICNAITCASLSMVAGRFQGRVIWLIPMVVLALVYSALEARKLKK
jgi:hypothetical protein